jgi:pimeloyl-ACP methyl ester carboxylesterase
MQAVTRLMDSCLRAANRVLWWKVTVSFLTCSVACFAVAAPPAVAANDAARAPQTREGYVDVPGARLWYWDTGGSGDAIVLLHPFTGSGDSWALQKPVFVAAGYRVIGYSRRGHFRSERLQTDAQEEPTASEDLHRLVEFLGLERFHLLGSAAGSFVAADYAISHPERLRSVVFASSLLGARDPEYLELTGRLIPEGFYRTPPDFRELGPSYRASNPEGTARWLEIEKVARAPGLSLPRSTHHVTFAKLAALRLPVLLLTGDADLYLPPPILMRNARAIPGSEAVVIQDAGHAAFWEQPAAFNDAVLKFLQRHRRQK